jgi:hypothetical protein
MSRKYLYMTSAAIVVALTAATSAAQAEKPETLQLSLAEAVQRAASTSVPSLTIASSGLCSTAR